MSNFVSRFSYTQTINKIIKYSANILFIGAIIILAYLSFVDNFYINPSIRNITTIALVSAALNYIVWEIRYRTDYDKVINADLCNKDYCIHKRYYLARKGWSYDALQKKIREYNNNFIKTWLQDVEDITGRTCDQIVKGGYRGNSHWFLIWRLKHRKYPKSGIKTPRDMLYMLSIGKSDSMRINTRRAEHHQTKSRLLKLVTVILSTILVASLFYEFIQDGIESALLKLLLNIILLFTSLIFGALAGIKGAQIKLADTEEVCEKLEEWKNEEPTEVPFKEPQAIPVVSSEKPPEKPAEEHKSITIECT